MSGPLPVTETSETSLDGVSVTYEVHRSERATRSRIAVDLRGVRVIVPAGSRTDPERLLATHAEWVVKKQAEYDERRKEVPKRRFEAGETFPYLGKPHEVVVERRSRSTVEDASLRLARHHVDQTSVKRALECLYRRKARETFTRQADRYAGRMGVEYGKIELRNQRTRWGSCSAKGTLSLNWRLVLAPVDASEYVVVHELAHLTEPNHGSRFWATVGEVLPDYESRKAWLRENRTRLIFTEDDL